MTPSDAPQVPDVSVIVIVYNDAERLPTAVRSVLRQTLKNVEVIIADDASTDSTPEVAEQLQAEDSRVRYHRLAQNSGGCGAPRNAGIGIARGHTVMFLDSDDRLERHACKNLLEALEDNDADVAMGMVRRQYMHNGRQTRWYPSLFEEPRVVSGFEDMPGLIDEVLSVNKIYRRSFLEERGISFPEDVHYEDQLWTFRIYNEASRIAIIPETVYMWRIFPPTRGHSITQQRNQIENFHHRLAVHHRLDEYIREHGTPELQRLKDIKFLSNDMRLYIADVIEGDGAVTAQVLVEAEAYLRAIPADRYDALPLALRAAYAMALRHDAEGLRQMMLLDRRNIFAPAVAHTESGTYLTNNTSGPVIDPNVPGDALENRLLAADGAYLLTAPLPTYHLLHELVRVERTGSSLELRGRTFDALGKLAAADGWSLGLEVKRQGKKGRTRLPVVIEHTGENEVRWRAVLPASATPPPLESTASWRLWVNAKVGPTGTRSPLIWHNTLTPEPVPLPLAKSIATSMSGSIGPGDKGDTMISIAVSPGRRRDLTDKVIGRYLPAAKRRVKDRMGRHSDRKVAMTRRLYAGWRRLPIENDHVVFDANMGTIYGDSPKYVYEALRRRHPNMKVTWVLPSGHPAPHPGVSVVKRHSLGYLKALARAKYWVDNQTFPAYVRKRPEQRYLQTWHGIPLKKMGKDERDRPLPKQHPDRGVDAWDELVIPNPYFERTFVPAYEYAKGMVRYGTPRNDVLVDGSLTQESARRELDLPLDAKVVLYAPTFRQDNRSDRIAVITPFDVEALLEGLDDNTFLLLRPHYLNRIKVPSDLRHRVIDIKSLEDVNVAYLAADVLITDYSSVMFDYALLRRPIVYFTYDYTRYLATRGTYVDLKEIGPGPFVTTTDELTAALRAALGDPQGVQREYGAKYSSFLELYCGHEDGMASERAVDALLDGGMVSATTTEPDTHSTEETLS